MITCAPAWSRQPPCKAEAPGYARRDRLKGGGVIEGLALNSHNLPRFCEKALAIKETFKLNRRETYVQHYLQGLAAQPDISNLNLWSVDVEIADEAAAA